MCVPSSAVCFMSRFLLVRIGWLGDVTRYSPRALCFVVVWNISSCCSVSCLRTLLRVSQCCSASVSLRLSLRFRFVVVVLLCEKNKKKIFLLLCCSCFGLSCFVLFCFGGRGVEILAVVRAGAAPTPAGFYPPEALCKG